MVLVLQVYIWHLWIVEVVIYSVGLRFDRILRLRRVLLPNLCLYLLSGLPSLDGTLAGSTVDRAVVGKRAMSRGHVAGASRSLIRVGGDGTPVIREDTHYLLLLSGLLLATNGAHPGFLAHGLGLGRLPTAASGQISSVLGSE